MNTEDQIQLIAKETVGEPSEVKKLRDRRVQAGMYTLYELTVKDDKHYAIGINTNSQRAAMMANEQQIEEIFGTEALPD